MTDVLLRDLDESVLVLTFNRPDRNNAWSPDLEEAYFGALRDAAADPDVKVIVVTGGGRSFCPGIDTEVLAAAARGEREPQGPRFPMTLARLVPKPVIAAINGACAGIGLILACSADLRFAARGVKLTTAFARRGLPAENSISWILPRLVGTGIAMDLLLSSRVVLAEEALELGLVNGVYEPEALMPATLLYAKDMATNCSPNSMAVIKRQVIADWERSSEESRHHAISLVSEMVVTADFAEGINSYREKRPPHFEGASWVVEVERDGR
jgi:enoyl-CoA hydratase/carnithine racemase